MSEVQLTESTFNAPHVSIPLAVWNAFCLFGLGLGTYMIIQSFSPRADEVRRSWGPGGLFQLFFAGMGLVYVDIWHASAQRTVEVGRERLVVRRWIEAATRREGAVYGLATVQRVRFLVEGGGAKIRIETGAGTSTFSIWFWNLDAARELARLLAARGIETDWSLQWLDA